VQLQLLRRFLPGHRVREDLQGPERLLLFPGPVHLPVVRSLRHQSESRRERELLRVDGGRRPGRQGRRLPQLRPVRRGVPQGEPERQLQGLGSAGRPRGAPLLPGRAGLRGCGQVPRGRPQQLPGCPCQDVPHRHCSRAPPALGAPGHRPKQACELTGAKSARGRATSPNSPRAVPVLGDDSRRCRSHCISALRWQGLLVLAGSYSFKSIRGSPAAAAGL